MQIGITEILLIFVLALIFIKPENMKDYSKKFFEMKEQIKEAKKEISDLKDDVNVSN